MDADTAMADVAMLPAAATLVTAERVASPAADA
jgi:hypothetical protein